MTEPSPHPSSKVYRVRLAVPKHLRETTARLYGVRHEFIRSLGTKDKREAIRTAPAVLSEFQTMLRAAEEAHAGRAHRLTDREVSALCGSWLAQREAESHHDVPGSIADLEAVAEFLADVEAAEADPDAASMWGDANDHLEDTGELRALLATLPYQVDHDSLRRLVLRLAAVKQQHTRDLIARARTGQWRPKVSSADFATTVAISPRSVSGCTVDALLDGWGLDRQWSRHDKPISRGFYDRLRTVERLAEFLGHRDARRVAKEDVTRWKGEMLGRKLHPATVRNDMSEMSALWKWGVAHGVVDSNPFAGLLPPKAKQKGMETRSFTDAEVTAILTAARRETGALRWLPWLLCLTGARLNEACQAMREDVLEVDGVTVFRIHDEGEGRSVKNADSRRMVPIHPALAAEGFLDYVSALPARSPLWPDLAPDSFGRRSGTGGRKVARWLKADLKITDPAVRPNHSWRHTFIERCRRVTMPTEVRSAITGHSGKVDESADYGAGMGTMVQVMAAHLAKVPGPLG